MAAPVYTAADFAAGLMRLLPTGRAWPREADSVLSQVVASQAPSYARLHARTNALLVDAFPSTAVELLPEWEAALGLPDPCAGPDQTVAQRQAHVVARLTQVNGPSIPSLTAFAAALGYTITITEFAISRFGRKFGSRFNGRAWAYTWQVNAPAISIANFRFGSGRFGDRYRTWNTTVLQCEFQRLAPAHTILLFNVPGGGSFETIELDALRVTPALADLAVAIGPTAVIADGVLSAGTPVISVSVIVS